ncbi:MAG TPA: hypothetical protein V6D33_02640, partial [Cyanophyceae cyanobacterium]
MTIITSSTASSDLQGQPYQDVEDAVIQVEALYKHYGKLVAVKGVKFAVKRGEIFGLIGPDGAGKTTT